MRVRCGRTRRQGVVCAGTVGEVYCRHTTVHVLLKSRVISRLSNMRIEMHSNPLSLHKIFLELEKNQFTIPFSRASRLR